MNELLEKLLEVDQKDDFEDIFQPASPEEIQSRVMEYINKICTKNPDGTYSSSGNVDLSGRNLKVLPVKFKEVKGNFNCSYNQLTSLEGAPRSVGRNFYCNYNLLTSLEGAPERVGGSFYCSNNPLSKEELKKTVDRDYLK